ncbi:hypothetical protein CGLO_11617 [Colletotrichum gloeosporioides Cg-14]|uniref:Uncharacterized protein n=1 Tax=Colletotrichum gloeosporioides (strain Cg-14) TaxID=1237896 RepID=T0LLB6_COLGC|nr:hypothetical protein CGLO_11617 [Colletotrichum gloeosporioides Cg-14]
MITIFVSP